MNLNAQTLPGIIVLLVGALLGFFAEKLTTRSKNAPQVRLLGVCLAVVGAIMVFLP